MCVRTSVPLTTYAVYMYKLYQYIHTPHMYTQYVLFRNNIIVVTSINVDHVRMYFHAQSLHTLILQVTHNIMYLHVDMLTVHCCLCLPLNVCHQCTYVHDFWIIESASLHKGVVFLDSVHI